MKLNTYERSLLKTLITFINKKKNRTETIKVKPIRQQCLDYEKFWLAS